MGEHIRNLPGQWTPQQLKAMELLALPFDNRTIKEKADEVGAEKMSALTGGINIPGLGM